MQNAKYNFNSLFIPRGKKVLGAKMNAYIPCLFFSCASSRCLSDHRHRYVASGIVIRKVEMLSNGESSKVHLK